MDNKKNTGPEPDRLSLPHEDWEDAVDEALLKPRPSDGTTEDDNKAPPKDEPSQ